MPSSSRSFSDSSPTFGMSRVISSGPSFVSRDSISCFSIWMLVNRSSRTRRPLVDARALVRADELLERVAVELAGVVLDLDALSGHAGNDAAHVRDHDLA